MNKLAAGLISAFLMCAGAAVYAQDAMSKDAMSARCDDQGCDDEGCDDQGCDVRRCDDQGRHCQEREGQGRQERQVVHGRSEKDAMSHDAMSLPAVKGRDVQDAAKDAVAK